jgi:hypothetical protein
VTTTRLLGVASVALGALLLCLAHDVRAWHDALGAGDARLVESPAAARWAPRTWLPFDPAARLLAIDRPVREREATRAFELWDAAPRGFDNGANRARLRAQAELALTEVVGDDAGRPASRAGTLLGIVIATGGTATPVDDGAAARIFDSAVRADSSNDAAKYDLELLLRRAQARGVRDGEGNGSGTRSSSAEGAGAGMPGSGY